MVDQGKGADHRVNAPLTTHPEWVPEPWPGCLRSCLEIAGFIPAYARFWHPSGMQTSLARVPGGRFPCGPETTTGYLLPTLRVGLTIGKEWEDLTQARAGTR